MWLDNIMHYQKIEEYFPDKERVEPFLCCCCLVTVSIKRMSNGKFDCLGTDVRSVIFMRMI